MAQYVAKYSKVTIDAFKFIKDFKSLTSGHAEMHNILENAGFSNQVFYNWKHRATPEGHATVRENIFIKLCDISGLNADNYIISRKIAAVSSKKESYTKKLSDGSKVTTYIKSAPDDKIRNSGKNELRAKLSSFVDNMSIYRTLLNLSEDTIINNHNIRDYVDIENKKSVLSLSTYFTISYIFITTYNNMAECPAKNAFKTLAKAYNDIYVGSIYFGDI